MIPKNFSVFVFLVLMVAACTSENPSGQPKNGYETIPESIPGLKISGPRSEKNVIYNLWPVICKAREIYQERLKDTPGLKGTVELTLSVEFNGEIGPYSIVRSTLEDPEIKAHLLRLISFMDFDPYGPQNSEANILVPIRFEP